MLHGCRARGGSQPIAATRLVDRDLDRDRPITPCAAAARQRVPGMEAKMRDLAVRGARRQARFGELSFLFDVSTQLQLRLDLPSMLDLAVQRLMSCIDATPSSIMLFDESQGVLEVKAAAGVDQQLVKAGRVAPGEGVAGHAYAKGESLVLTPKLM